MYRIGIDVGSTYTKYCIMDGANRIVGLCSEKTPVRQKTYFEEKCGQLKGLYPDSRIISCGYGKKNIQAVQNISELTALARGAYYVGCADGLVLDIGGQDTKVIYQERGRLKQFFLNDKCAAGSGMFLSNTLEYLAMDFDDINLDGAEEPDINITSICAVFAQSEIVSLIAENCKETDIIQAVIWQIFVKAKPLLEKVEKSQILLSGGLTQIKGFQEFGGKALGQECKVAEHGSYLSAVGCAADL